MAVVFALFRRSVVNASCRWHLKSSSTKMLRRCFTMLPILGRSLQLSLRSKVCLAARHTFLLHATTYRPCFERFFGGDLSRDKAYPQLGLPALPRLGPRMGWRALRNHATRNLVAVTHDSKTERESLFLLSCRRTEVGNGGRRQG